MSVKFLQTPLFIGLRCLKRFPADSPPSAGEIQAMNQEESPTQTSNSIQISFVAAAADPQRERLKGLAVFQAGC